MNINLRILNYLFVLVCLITEASVSVRAEERTFTRINSISELESAEGFIVVNEYYKLLFRNGKEQRVLIL